MSYRKLTFKITGAAPLILHNGQTADPLNFHSKNIAEITGKRKKTDADHLEIARREWAAGMYTANSKPCIPCQMWDAGLVAGAKKHKRGPQTKAGLYVEEHSELEYDGPRNPDELWTVESFRLRVSVKVGTSRIMRTRPIFNKWGCKVTIHYQPNLLNAGEITSFITTLGDEIGLGDWRPRYGRFAVASLA